MTKRVFGNDEEKYSIFELTKGNVTDSFIVSDNLFKQFNKLQEWAEAMRDYIDVRDIKACKKMVDRQIRESELRYVRKK